VDTSKVRIEWNDKAFEELRRLPTVKAELYKHAVEIATEANEAHNAKGYIAVQGEGKSRSRAAVVTSDGHSIASNQKHHTLEKITAEKAIS
jgi:hypothetical protein